jgi:hypothetical protein
MSNEYLQNTVLIKLFKYFMEIIRLINAFPEIDSKTIGINLWGVTVSIYDSHLCKRP